MAKKEENKHLLGSIVVGLLALGLAMVLSVVAFPVCAFLWWHWRNENSERLTTVKIGTVVTGIMAVITIFAYANSDTTQPTTQQQNTAQVESTSSSIAESKKEEKKSAESAWTEINRDDAVPVYIFKPNGGISSKSNIMGLGSLTVNTLKEDHEKLTNGAIFTLAETFDDDYGNKKEEYIATMYFSPETLNRINYDNWPNKQEPEGINALKTADSTFVSPMVLNKGKKGDTELFDFINKNLENVPENFFNYRGQQ